MATLEDAIQLALTAHRGQATKDGSPYILHPLRLMSQMHSEDERIVAVLHDVVEDSVITLDDLRVAGFSEAVVSAVDALTHREDEEYMAYVQRAKQNPLAKRVKMADLTDNMNFQRLLEVSEKDLNRMKRYHAAWLLITDKAE